MKHHREKHSHIVGGSDSTTQSDAVFSYSVLIITLGLIRAIHNRAIQTGNGENIILLYKYVHNLCVHYKICGIANICTGKPVFSNNIIGEKSLSTYHEYFCW